MPRDNSSRHTLHEGSKKWPKQVIMQFISYSNTDEALTPFTINIGGEKITKKFPLFEDDSHVQLFRIVRNFQTSTEAYDLWNEMADKLIYLNSGVAWKETSEMYVTSWLMVRAKLNWNLETTWPTGSMKKLELQPTRPK